MTTQAARLALRLVGLATLPKSEQPSPRQVVDFIKLTVRCEVRGVRCIDTHPDGLSELAADYHLDHLELGTKYRTASGKPVEPSDLAAKFGLLTNLREVMKCRVVCSVCHTRHTHTVQRGN